MKKKLMNNLGFKIISLFLAIVFWLVVVSIEDPEDVKTLNLAVTKMNDHLIRENDKTYEVIEGNNVIITVRARQSILKDLSSEDFEAVADFAKLSFTGAVPIEVTALKNVNQINIIKGANQVMQISIEDLASVDKMVSTKAEGSVITGKAIGNIKVDPTMIRIEGAKTTIDRIASVYALINVAGISQDCSYVVEPILYDSNGNIIDATDVTFSEDQLKVNVSLLNTKSVPVKWNINAEPAFGYGIESLDYSPSEVLIAGSEEVLEKIDEIVLDDYNASNLTENVVSEVDIEELVKSQGGFLVNSEAERNVKLAINVSQYNRKAGNIEFDQIKLKGRKKDLEYTYVGDSAITYSVYGLDSTLETLDFSKMNFSADVTELEEGTHTLDVLLETSQKVELDSALSIKVRITKK